MACLEGETGSNPHPHYYCEPPILIWLGKGNPFRPNEKENTKLYHLRSWNPTSRQLMRVIDVTT